ncbi:MAG: NeuD/PglB/VioB family sugar acetyltransferase [Magnetococcales bacterium]|nr:NeuD/PglB/VioB family sugar acetyltransferase [Magnetococcales bacterium]MBF0437764.1 NeuD/PglB/VioB family sugar acetyltransferase [Magnetococcales bacterium]
MKCDWIVLGAGGHARVIVDLLEQAGWLSHVRGVLALEVTALERERLFATLPWLGGDEFLLNCSPEETQLVNGIGSIGKSGLRMEAFMRSRAMGFAFVSLIHPGAMVSAGVRLGEGVQIMARGVVQTGAVLAENVLVNTGAIVEHDCMLNAHVHVATGAVVCGGVRVGYGTHIGCGAVVKQGIEIGSHAVIGAGAVVVRDVRDGVVVVGCPAREIER